MTLQELSQLFYLKKEIKKDQERLAQIKSKSYTLANFNQAEKTTAATKQKAKDSAIERYTADMVDLQEIIDAKITQCVHERNRLERYITAIPDSLTRQIFIARFVHGLPWVQVALSVGGNNTEDGVKKICYRYIGKSTN